MIVLAALFAAPLAMGCHRVDRSIRCDLAPPVVVVPPAATPIVRRDAPPPAHRKPHREARRRPAPAPAAPPTDAEITRHVESLVAIGDCTGVRTLLVSVGKTAFADSDYHMCIGLPPTPGVPRPAPPGPGITAK